MVYKFLQPSKTTLSVNSFEVNKLLISDNISFTNDGQQISTLVWIHENNIENNPYSNDNMPIRYDKFLLIHTPFEITNIEYFSFNSVILSGIKDTNRFFCYFLLDNISDTITTILESYFKEVTVRFEKNEFKLIYLNLENQLYCYDGEIVKVDIDFDEIYFPNLVFKKNEELFIFEPFEMGNVFFSTLKIPLRGKFIDIIRTVNVIDPNEYITIEKIKSSDEWNEQFNKRCRFLEFPTTVIIIEVDGKKMIDAFWLKKPIPYGNIFYHNGIIWYQTEDTLYPFSCNTKIAFKIKKRTSERYCYCKSYINSARISDINSIYPIEYEIGSKDVLISDNENKIEIHRYTGSPILDNLKLVEVSKLTIKRNETFNMKSSYMGNCSALFNEKCVYFFAQALMDRNPSHYSAIGTVRMIKYGGKKLSEKIKDVDFIFPNTLLVITENNIECLKACSDAPGREPYFKRLRSFNLNDHIAVDKFWVNNIRKQRNSIPVEWSNAKINIPTFFSPKDMLACEIAQFEITNINLFSLSENAEGEGARSQMRDFIDDYLAKDVFQTVNIWSRVNPDSLKDNSLLNAICYLIILSKFNHILKFRVPVQIIQYMYEQSENKKVDLQKDLEYFVKLENPDSYKKWKEDPRPEIYGMENEIDVFKMLLYYDPAIDHFFETNQKIIHNMMGKIYCMNKIFSQNPIPNLASLDWLYSDEISIENMINNFIDNLIIQGNDDANNKINAVFKRASTSQLETFLFNISGLTRFVPGKKYTIRIVKGSHIRFTSCATLCEVPETLMEEDVNVILAALTLKIVAMSDNNVIINQPIPVQQVTQPNDAEDDTFNNVIEFYENNYPRLHPINTFTRVIERPEELNVTIGNQMHNLVNVAVRNPETDNPWTDTMNDQANDRNHELDNAMDHLWTDTINNEEHNPIEVVYRQPMIPELSNILIANQIVIHTDNGIITLDRNSLEQFDLNNMGILTTHFRNLSDDISSSPEITENLRNLINHGRSNQIIANQQEVDVTFGQGGQITLDSHTFQQLGNVAQQLFSNQHFVGLTNELFEGNSETARNFRQAVTNIPEVSQISGNIEPLTIEPPD